MERLSAQCPWSGDLQIQPPGPSTSSSSWTGQSKPAGSPPAGWWYTLPACPTLSASWIPARRNIEKGDGQGLTMPASPNWLHANAPPPTLILLCDPLINGRADKRPHALKNAYYRFQLYKLLIHCFGIVSEPFEVDTLTLQGYWES